MSIISTSREEFEQKYQLLKEITTEGVRSHHAVASTGAVVMVHIFDGGASKENLATLAAIERLGEADRHKVLRVLDVEGTPAVVTRFILDFKTLPEWVSQRAAPESGASAAPDAPALASPELPPAAAPGRPQEMPTASKAEPPSAPAEPSLGFTGLFQSPVAPSSPEPRAAEPAASAGAPPEAPVQRPDESEQVSSRPIVPIPSEPEPEPEPDQAGSFTSMFRTVAKPEPAAPPAQPEVESKTEPRPPAAGQAEGRTTEGNETEVSFTSLFRVPSVADETSAPPATETPADNTGNAIDSAPAAGSAPASPDAGEPVEFRVEAPVEPSTELPPVTGEVDREASDTGRLEVEAAPDPSSFSQIFKAASPAPEEKKPESAAEAEPQPGSFTQMFRTTSPPASSGTTPQPAGPSAGPPPPDRAATDPVPTTPPSPKEPGEFTQVFMSAELQRHRPAPPSPPSPASPQKPSAPLPEWDVAPAPTASPAPPNARAPEPPAFRLDAEPARPAPRQPPPPEAPKPPAKTGEFTQMFGRSSLSGAAQPTPPAAPPTPPSAQPPAPAPPTPPLYAPPTYAPVNPPPPAPPSSPGAGGASEFTRIIAAVRPPAAPAASGAPPTQPSGRPAPPPEASPAAPAPERTWMLIAIGAGLAIVVVAVVGLILYFVLRGGSAPLP
jgi:hypothetical protein